MRTLTLLCAGLGCSGLLVWFIADAMAKSDPENRFVPLAPWVLYGALFLMAAGLILSMRAKK